MYDTHMSTPGNTAHTATCKQHKVIPSLERTYNALVFILPSQHSNLLCQPGMKREWKTKGSSKNFLWASRLWVGRRKEPILGYVPKNDEKNNLVHKRLKKMKIFKFDVGNHSCNVKVYPSNGNKALNHCGKQVVLRGIQIREKRK